MNIVIGSIVICKIIVSSPEFDAIQKENTTSQKQSTESTVNGNSQVGNVLSVITGNQPKSTTPTEEKIEQKYAMIKGVVEDIREFSYLKEVPEYNKFKYEKEYSYIIKTDEYEKILIKSTACGNYEQFVVSESQLDKIKQKKAEIEALQKEQETVQKQKPLIEEDIVTAKKINKIKKIKEVDPFEEIEKSQLNMFPDQVLIEEQAKAEDKKNATVVPEVERVDVQKILDQQKDEELAKNKIEAESSAKKNIIEKPIKKQKGSQILKRDRIILKDALNPFYK